MAALAALMPVLVRMIDGDLSLKEMDAGGEPEMTVEEITIYLKKVSRQVRAFSPLLSEQIEEAVEVVDETPAGVLVEMS
jgi:hypothetical protein